MKELKIEVPQGYEIDKEKSTFEKIVFKKVEEKITWKKAFDKEGYIIEDAVVYFEKDLHSMPSNKDVFKSKEIAEAVIALAQLEWLRDEYIKRYYPENPNWKPYWNISDDFKHCVNVHENELYKSSYRASHSFLAFPTAEIRDKFLEEQIDLIEQAKPLL
ncbi:hypothetical protein [Capnocytophaga catalasegens]|uniref:Uncharacterized protein n=1 Tax=Capnocytophaga catalasegens TaxID=1004260 RepID=A0AAV5AX00_9FLAO|nr:hypothetical protein [Capnocytophaga catalasegens]GIZ15523.1 hypothetical protein RCZ03_15230 [Capnocytophaga catalasegens]GJM49866.1 hypothetical protein RCZ15_08410 [Capnocytophaga catalasegens]GJM54038.1 hypothetical protein RCZ16_23540 [Capnocytophaga catalasegens]